MEFRRMESPVDYKQLWHALTLRLGELATDKALRCVTEGDEAEIRRLQGGFTTVHDVLGEMVKLLDSARSALNQPDLDA